MAVTTSTKTKVLSISALLSAAAAVITNLPTSTLDHLRHWLAYIFAADSTGPNIGAWVICGVIAALGTYLIWPRLRAAVNGWVSAHLHAHLQAQQAQHAATVAAITNALAAHVDQLQRQPAHVAATETEAGAEPPPAP